MKNLPMIHLLKCWPSYFNETWKGNKLFEVRKDDRGFSVGDILILQEWDPITEKYPGREIRAEVTYRLPRGVYARFGMDKDYCILSLKIIGKFHRKNMEIA